MTLSHPGGVLTLALILFPVLAADAHAQRLLEVDGIELQGTARLVMSEAGSCNVLETDTSYEEKKANHGASMDVWRLDFSVRNGSGRWLDHLIARFEIDSEWPDCTNWSDPGIAQLRELNPEVPLEDMAVDWAGTAGFIQESGRNVVAPDQTLTDTNFIIVLRGDPEPRFVNWSVDFNFAAGPPPVAPAADAPGSPAPATAEQDNLFWQSVMNSTNPADFEAYLEQFPNGVFGALARNRLAALRAPAGPGAGGAASSASASRVSGDRDPSSSTAVSEDSASGVPANETCTSKPAGAACWMELANQPECYVWNPNLSLDATVTWTGACSGGLAQGTGTLIWILDSGQRTQELTGRLQAGKMHSQWVLRFSDGDVVEGSYVDGQRHGQWVLRLADGGVQEGPYVDGQQHGHWVLRFSDGTVQEGPMVEGQQQGHWVVRLADGRVAEGPMVEGQQQGHYVVRSPDGTVQEGPMVEGERHGQWVLRSRTGAYRKAPMWTASGTATGSCASRTGAYRKAPMWTASGTATGSCASRTGP